eukprot:UN29979
MDCHFQLYAFNKSFEKCFSNSVQYDQKTLEKADAWVQNLRARGGTSIDGCLIDVLEKRTSSDYPRNVILLTDGQVSNADKCFSIVKRHNSKARVFTMGVGNSFSEGLCRGLAKAGYGTFEGVRNNDEIGQTVIRVLNAVLGPTLQSYKLDLGGWSDKNMIQVPHELNTFYPGKNTNLYFLKTLASEGEGEDYHPPESFNIKLDLVFSDGKSTNLKLDVNLSPVCKEGYKDVIMNSQSDLLVHRLMAKQRIEELQRTTKVGVKNEIIRLGKTYNIATKYTSFIAIHETKEGEQTELKFEE